MTLLISRILVTAALVWALYLTWTHNVDLILWAEKQIKSKLPIVKTDDDGVSGKDIEYMRSSQEKIVKRLEEAALRDREILQNLKRKRKSLLDRFMEQYDGGYALYYTDGKKVIYDAPREGDSVKWETITILHVDDTKVSARLPDFKIGGLRSQNNGFILSRKPGAQMKIFRTREISVETQYISDEEDGALFVIGFRQLEPPRRDP